MNQKPGVIIERKQKKARIISLEEIYVSPGVITSGDSGRRREERERIIKWFRKIFRT